MKKILVTGGAGFIGSNLIKKLIENDYDVTSLDNYSTGATHNEVEGARYINDDIENIFKLKTNFDVCFHLAAQSRVQPSFDDPLESVRTNITGTTKVMEWAKTNNIKVIYAGSSSRHHEPSDSPYAMTKFLGEEICRLYKKSFNVNVEIARFYNVYGPYEPLDEKFGNVIGIWQVKVNKNLPLPIVGDGNQKRDFIHVEDIADGLIKLALSNKKNTDAWELGTGFQYSVNELYKFFEERYSKIDFIKIDDQPGNYRNSFRKNDQMTVELNWQPKDRLRDYIQSLD